MNQDLNENWTLRNKNFDKEILLATILHKYDDFPVLETNPILFKYQADIWWGKHYRTFSKWFDAFDLSYDPLVNNWFKEDRILSENEAGNTYNRFNNQDSVTDHHIGDSYSNQDFHNEYTDHQINQEKTDNDTTNQTGKTEITDNDTTNIKTVEATGDTTNNSIKDGTNNKVMGDESHTKTKSDQTVDTNSANFSNEHSGGNGAEFGDTPGDLDFNEPGTANRTTESKVSAYNSTDYEPSQKDIISGDMGTIGRNSTSVRTHGLADDNDVHVKDDKSEDEVYSELNASNEQTKNNSEEHNQGSTDQTITTNEIGKGTSDTIKDFEDNKDGQNTNNTQVTENDKYINNSNGKHTGDSQQKNFTDHNLTENSSRSGNLGTMTSQEMLTAEIRVQLYSIYDQISELFVDENCICIFTNDRRGCCW